MCCSVADTTRASDVASVEEKEPDPYENLLVWKDLDEAATNALLEEADPEAQYRCGAVGCRCAVPRLVLTREAFLLFHLGRLLSETLGMASGEGDTNLRQGILLDFLFYNLQCVSRRSACVVPLVLTTVLQVRPRGWVQRGTDIGVLLGDEGDDRRSVRCRMSRPSSSGQRSLPPAGT